MSCTGRGPVGVDVLCVKGGIFFRVCKTVWVRCLVLDDCLVIDGVVLVVLFGMILHSYAGSLF